MNTYSHPEWARFREEVINLDGGRCLRCDRSRTDGAVLQVHHRSYLAGRRPWEYARTECETLCKGCHAQEHGIIMPQSDWFLIASDDLGDLSGKCECCGNALRYIYAIIHPKWGSMAVGTDCCNRLTMTSGASAYHEARIKKRQQRARFIDSDRWKQHDNAWSITQKKIEVWITLQGEKYRISMDGVDGSQEYDSLRRPTRSRKAPATPNACAACCDPRCRSHFTATGTASARSWMTALTSTESPAPSAHATSRPPSSFACASISRTPACPQHAGTADPAGTVKAPEFEEQTLPLHFDCLAAVSTSRLF